MQGVDRLQAGRLRGRIASEHDSDEDTEADRGEPCRPVYAHRGTGGKAVISDCTDRQHQPDQAAEGGENAGFTEELEHDVLPLCAYGLSDADLPGAFRDRYQHDIHNADPADEQGNRSDPGKEQGHGISHIVHGVQHVGLAAHSVGFFVPGRLQEKGFNAVDRRVHRAFAGCLDIEAADAFLPCYVDGCGVGDEDFAVVASGKTRPLFFQNTDHLVNAVSDDDRAVDCVPGAEQICRRFRPEDADTGIPFYVRIRDLPSALDINVPDREIVRRDPDNGIVPCIAAFFYGFRGSDNRGGAFDGRVGSEGFDVLGRDRCLIVCDGRCDQLRTHIGNTVRDPAGSAFGDRYKDNHSHNADDDAEHGQKGPHFIVEN